MIVIADRRGVLDYSPTLGAGVRQSLRPVLIPTDPMGICRNLVTTLEVFDRTSGRTFVLQLSDPIVPVDPMAPGR